MVLVGDPVEVGPGIPGPPGPPGPAGSAALLAAGEATIPLSGHRVVTPGPDGMLGYASNDDPDHLAAPLWVTLGAAGAGAPVSALMIGPLTEPSWNWTPGPVYLGINGMLTQTPPTAPAALFLAQVGAAIGPTTIIVDRSPSIHLI